MCLPDGQYPLGSTISGGRRALPPRWVLGHRVRLIEDDFNSETTGPARRSRRWRRGRRAHHLLLDLQLRPRSRAAAGLPRGAAAAGAGVPADEGNSLLPRPAHGPARHRALHGERSVRRPSAPGTPTLPGAVAGTGRRAEPPGGHDEVYRGTNQTGDGFTASVADLYERGISTASMSKTYALARLRLGWIAAPESLVHAVSIHRDYTTTSVGMLDDHFAAIALENQKKILARSRTITRTSLAILAEWVDGEPLISWVNPQSRTTALLSTRFRSRRRSSASSCSSGPASCSRPAAPSTWRVTSASAAPTASRFSGRAERLSEFIKEMADRST